MPTRVMCVYARARVRECVCVTADEATDAAAFWYPSPTVIYRNWCGGLC